MSATLRFGTAGWSFPDWGGIVYPKPRPRGFDPLSFLSEYLDTIEINSSFYRPPSEKDSCVWLNKIEARPEFRFSVKLWQGFTHEQEPFGADEVKRFRKGVDILLEAGRLSAILIQFPWAFKNTDESRKRLDAVVSAFSDYPLVLEVRHSSWNNEEFYESLRESGVGFVNIDQPVFSRSIKPSGKATAPVGYVRLHGRNYENWFSESEGSLGHASRDARYDYLYSIEELNPWAQNIKALERDCREVYIIANNHFQGKAVVNALELKQSSTGEKIKVPATLLARYPRLKRIAKEESRRETYQPDLFCSDSASNR